MSHDLMESIKSFIAIAEQGSFAAAARQLHISAPVLTKHIHWLEETLQHRLFDRTTRHVDLTEAGKIYLTHAKKIIEEIDSAREAVLNIEHEPHGNIIVGISTDMCGKLFTKKFQKFLEKYPKISLTHVVSHDPNILFKKQADLTISWENNSHPQLIKKSLFSSPLKVYASPAYIEKFGAPISIAELNRHNCLININHPEWEFDHKQIQVSGQYRSETSIHLYYTALKGLGLFQTLSILVEEDIKTHQLIEIKLDLKPAVRNVYLYHLQVHKSSIVRLLADYLLK
jgi:DNA-binding transcriptional LysR family regulator